MIPHAKCWMTFVRANVTKVIKRDNIKKQIHAVSTCSPDCPTESAVERALVDLEWRREAASKRNGNTHRINTQVLQTKTMPQSKGDAHDSLPTLGLQRGKKWHCVWMDLKINCKPHGRSDIAFLAYASSILTYGTYDTWKTKGITSKPSSLYEVQQRSITIITCWIQVNHHDNMKWLTQQ